jgi:uncharacterized membrane protein
MLAAGGPAFDMDRIALLQKLPLFEGLAPDDLAQLAAGTAERSFKVGELICKKGDDGATMFIIAEGQVNLFLPGPKSERLSLKDIGPGEYFGELALFDDKPRSASAQCTTDVELLELGRDALTTYLKGRPHAAMAILRTMSERLRSTNALLSNSVSKNAVAEVEQGYGWADRLADKVADFNGSWAFIIILFGLTIAWMFANSSYINHKFDEYPYQFYNLFLAILVALQGPLIMMSQNRQTLRDRATAANDYKINLKNETNIDTILREMGEFRTETLERLRRLEDERQSGQAPTARAANGESTAPAE